MTCDQYLSKTISVLRFPMMVGVVMIHSAVNQEFSGGGYEIAKTLSYLFTDVLPQVCVPLFFFFSGFLFFYKTKSFDLATYGNKLKKRCKTILLPYIIWNVITLLFFQCADMCFHSLMSGKNKVLVDFSFSDWLWAFWDFHKVSPNNPLSYPVCFQMWFTRDLMVAMLFTPVIWHLLNSN